MKIYIAGAITNNPDYKEQFIAAEQLLRAAGHEVLNPIRNTGEVYKDFIDKGLAQLQKCEAICMLPGYEESRGATLELKYAETVGLQIIEMQEGKAMRKEKMPELKEWKGCGVLNTVNISVDEYTRLKDIETRFAILKSEMLKASYCPIHHQIILGIENEYAAKQEIKTDLFPDALRD